MSGAQLDAAGLIALRGLAAAAPRAPESLSPLPGAFTAKAWGQGQEIAEIRTYVPGDDARAVDRNVTARTGVLHVRTHHADRDRAVMLVADFRPSMLWGVSRAFRSVAAAEILTVLGWRAVEAGGRVGLIAVTAGDGVVVPARGRTRGMLDVIGGMVRAHAAALDAARGDLADPPLDAALEKVLRVTRGSSAVLLASGLDTPGPGLDSRLAEIADRSELHCLGIGDGVRSGLPPGLYRMMTPGGREARAVLGPDADTADPERLIDPSWPPARALAAVDGAHGRI